MGQPSALNISEILLQILEYVDEYDPVSLPTAIRVNRHWFICGTDILWRHGTCDALAIVPKSRRQIYASKMTSLDFSKGDWTAYHSRFKHLEFTTIRDISIGSHGPQSGRQLRPYLQPPLEHLYFQGRQLDTELVQHLQTHCRRLRCILIDSRRERVTAECFSNFLASCNFLQHVKILRGLEHLLTDELMLHLAGRSNLLSLGTTKTFSVRLLQQILAQVNQPFRALDAFHTAVPSAAVPLVVSFAANLTSLHLEVRDAGDSVIGDVSSLTNLHILSLYFTAPTKLSRQHLVSLKNLSKLHTLHIGPCDDESASELTAFESGFTDADFIEMISQYWLLFRFHFMVQCDLSSSVLVALAQNCAFLEDCALPHVIDFEIICLIIAEDWLLRRLRSLSLGGIRPEEVADDDDGMSSEELASLMKRGLPALQELYLASEDDFSAGVADAFAILETSQSTDGSET